MAAAGAGPGPGASPGLEATLQKLALRRKKVLSGEEMELYELAQAAGGAIDPDVFKILVDLLKLNVAPLAVFQMLKSMCAGQRLASETPDPAVMPLPASSVPETRGAHREVGVLGPVVLKSKFHVCLSRSQPVFNTEGLRLPLMHVLSALPPQLWKTVTAFVESNESLSMKPREARQEKIKTEGRNKSSAAVGGAPALVERSSREGSSQRRPRQPSATRLPKGGGPGKSPTRGST